MRAYDPAVEDASDPRLEGIEVVTDPYEAVRGADVLAVLTEFAARGINLTRLESRPTRSKMGEYVFLVDADGHLAEPAMADVVGALTRRSALLRWLGSYPRAAGTNVPAAAFATAKAYTEASDQIRRWQQGEWT